MKEELRRCPGCMGWTLKDDPKRFNYIVCVQCGHKEIGRMNSVVEPTKEKRGFIASACDRIVDIR